MRRGSGGDRLDAVEEGRCTEYLAECFWPGVTENDLTDLDGRARASAEATAGVRYLGSMFVPGDEVVFCFFDAPSTEAVQAVAERGAIPFERIVESVHVPATAKRRGEP